MPIRPFLPDSHSFDLEDIANMSAAFEAALGKLGLVDRTDPATMAVAKLVIAFAKAGHRIPSGCAPWHCSNYQSKLPQEPLARPTFFKSDPSTRSPDTTLKRVPGTPSLVRK